MKNRSKEYKNYSMYFDKVTSRWISYISIDGYRYYVTSAKSLENLKNKLDKNPTPRVVEKRGPKDFNIGDGVLFEINKCRRDNGLEELEIKNRTCLKCNKLFISIGNRVCRICKCKNDAYGVPVLSGVDII